MKLYYTPGACSMASHIVATEAGIPLDLVRVDLATKTTENGKSFKEINPKNYVPYLVRDNAAPLTEGVAILTYLATLKPGSTLAPARDSDAFIEFLDLMTYLSTEVHKTLGGLFAPLPEEAKVMMRARAADRFAYLNQHLQGRDYLFGDHFTAADAYAFTVLGWTSMLQLDLSGYSNLVAFQKRIAARSAVQKTMAAEGLPPMVQAA